MPVVSVVVPVHNSSTYLEECLYSIRSQSHEALEIVCVNDGSTDASADILAHHAQQDARIVVLDQANQGVSAARNRGLDAAGGEFVVFIDSDDTIEVDFVARFLTELSHADPSDIDLVIEGGATTERYNTPEERGLLLQIGLRTALLNSPWGKIYRRSVIEKTALRFHRDVSLGEDLLFNVEYLAHARTVRLISSRLYHNRSSPGSLTRSYRPTKYAELSLVHRRLRVLTEKSVTDALTPGFGSLLAYLRIKSLLSCVRDEMSSASGLTLAEAKNRAQRMEAENPGLVVTSGDLWMRGIGTAYRWLGLWRLARLVTVIYQKRH